jgi:hypothetical protein
MAVGVPTALMACTPFALVMLAPVAIGVPTDDADITPAGETVAGMDAPPIAVGVPIALAALTPVAAVVAAPVAVGDPTEPVACCPMGITVAPTPALTASGIQIKRSSGSKICQGFEFICANSASVTYLLHPKNK